MVVFGFFLRLGDRLPLFGGLIKVIFQKKKIYSCNKNQWFALSHILSLHKFNLDVYVLQFVYLILCPEKKKKMQTSIISIQSNLVS